MRQQVSDHEAAINIEHAAYSFRASRCKHSWWQLGAFDQTHANHGSSDLNLDFNMCIVRAAMLLFC